MQLWLKRRPVPQGLKTSNAGPRCSGSPIPRPQNSGASWCCGSWKKKASRKSRRKFARAKARSSNCNSAPSQHFERAWRVPMPKRSLHPENGGKGDPRKIDQLNKAVEAMLSRADGKAGKVETGIEPLVRIAAALRDLPRADFKAQLKTQLESELEGRRKERKNMTSVAEPVTAVRTTATPRLTFKDAAKDIQFYKKSFGAKGMMCF